MNQLHMAYISLETPMGLKVTIKGVAGGRGPGERGPRGQTALQVSADS